MTLTVTTSAFRPDGRIPNRFTRDGGNVSPEIEWQGAPPQTRSYALVVEDPDAPRGTFRHWAAYDIPADTHRLDEGIGSRQNASTLHMAMNDFGNTQYDGPQPPPGHGTHHYHFRLFALDVPKLDVPPNCAAANVLRAAQSHALDEGDVVGTFER
ncbi:MAG: YbhB/YbcL family Raf kinase inhibitor-like protein [Steroidobacteraceae bacterium]|nr:YbhB/YbcL family Raf kinase inhibitor-like protein [Steroidobacteraceae bacterium]